MSKHLIGSQLDALGLAVEMDDGGRVSKAEIDLVVEYPHGFEVVPKLKVPTPAAGDTPVPHPLETRIVTIAGAHQKVNDEQRERIHAWLVANGIDPKEVASGHPVTVEYQTSSTTRDRRSSGHIHFAEYYTDASGSRVVEAHSHPMRALTVQRCVAETVALAPEPSRNVDG
ncbi:hypothetical protein [Streptomyces sp. NPDC093589]|uniref:hypothetical protein n=1 Tax=Streptomyces sp. NPDC093589 TaxID=3366043 RepID=UPI0038300A94